MNLSDIVKIFYIDWFFALLFFLMALGLTFLLFKPYFYTKTGLNSGSIKFYSALTLIYVAAFYVILPVPLSVQSELSSQIISTKNNNHSPQFIFTNLRLAAVCNSQYISALEYFSIKDSFSKDFDMLMKKNSFVALGSIEGNAKPIDMSLCSLKGQI